jgi:hypothetical protein
MRSLGWQHVPLRVVQELLYLTGEALAGTRSRNTPPSLLCSAQPSVTGEACTGSYFSFTG